MEKPDMFTNFNAALAKHYLAEQKMIHHSQATLLAQNKMIKSAQMLHYTILQLKEIPESLKTRLQQAIDTADISMILSVSRQIQEIVALLRLRYKYKG